MKTVTIFKPKVSIVIPVFNGANFLRSSIGSALNQTYKNIEIIVVNDGSNDNGETERVALTFGDKIKYFSKINGGVSSALNYGISKMDGTWMSWLSHDDLYDECKIENQVNYLSELILSNPDIDIESVFLYGNTDYIDVNGEIVLKLRPIAVEAESNLDIMIKNIKNNRLGGCSFLVPKKMILTMNGFDENIRTVSDYDMWYRLMLHGYRLYFVRNSNVYGRVHKDQVTYKLTSIAQSELMHFYDWFAGQLHENTDYRKWDNFWKLGRYSYQRGFFEVARKSFTYAQNLLDNDYIYYPLRFCTWLVDILSVLGIRVKKQLVKLLIYKKKSIDARKSKLKKED